MGTRIERPCSPAFATRAPATSALRRAASPSLPLRPSSLASIRPISTPGMSRPRPPSVQLAGTSRPSTIRSPSPTRSPSSSPSPAPLPLSSRRSASPLRPASPQPLSGVYRNPYHRLSSSPPAVRPPSPARAQLRRPRSPSPAVTRAVPPALEVHGDSFAGVFSLVGSRAIVHKYKGASARGLNNSHSTLQVAPKVLKNLEETRSPAVLLVFGTVDLAINYLWQLKAKGSSASSQREWADKVLADYAAFLAQAGSLAKRRGIQIFVAGALPPVVEDRYLEAMRKKYLERDAVGPLPSLPRNTHPHDLATRALMVKRYNLMLGAFCARHTNLSFVDISKDLVDPLDAKRVSAHFRDSEDPTNCHLVWETTLPFWLRALPPLASLSSSFSHPQQLERLERSRAAYALEKRERVRSGSFGSLGSSARPVVNGGARWSVALS